MGARGNSGVIMSQILRGFSTIVADSTRSTAQRSRRRWLPPPRVRTAQSATRWKARSSPSCASRARLPSLLPSPAPICSACLMPPAPKGRVAAAHADPAQGPRRCRCGRRRRFGSALPRRGAECRRRSSAPRTRCAGASGIRDGAPIEATITNSIADLRYEVMFLLDAPDESIPGFKAAWAEVGDSIVVVGGDGIFNCHIHCDDIGAAIECGIDVADPTRSESPTCSKSSKGSPTRRIGSRVNSQ